MSAHETAINVLKARRDELIEKLEVNANEGAYYHNKSQKYADEELELDTRIQSVTNSILALGGTIIDEVQS